MIVSVVSMIADGFGCYSYVASIMQAIMTD